MYTTHHNNGEVLRTYFSEQEICDDLQITPTQLSRILLKGKPYNGIKIQKQAQVRRLPRPKGLTKANQQNRHLAIKVYLKHYLRHSNTICSSPKDKEEIAEFLGISTTGLINYLTDIARELSRLDDYPKPISLAKDTPKDSISYVDLDNNDRGNQDVGDFSDVGDLFDVGDFSDRNPNPNLYDNPNPNPRNTSDNPNPNPRNTSDPNPRNTSSRNAKGNDLARGNTFARDLISLRDALAVSLLINHNETKARISQQVDILYRAQGDSHERYLSTDLNGALDLQLKSNKEGLDLLKFFTTVIEREEKRAESEKVLEEDSYITPDSAVRLLSARKITNFIPGSPRAKEIAMDISMEGLPVVSAITQEHDTDKEMLGGLKEPDKNGVIIEDYTRGNLRKPLQK